MLNYNKDQIIEGIKHVELNNSAFLFKNFIKNEFVPTWQDILKAIYRVSDNEFDSNLWEQLNQSKESLIGKLIITDKIYFNYMGSHDELKISFPNVLKMLESINSICGFEGFPIYYYGPKVSIAPYHIKPHKDKWNGFSLQCEGTATWILTDQHGNSEKFVMEKGDLLYFNKEMWHEIVVDGPRASILFNSQGILHK